MRPDVANIEQVAEALLQGNVIAYPTEAVWGLGCDPFNEQAVSCLLQLKNRSVEKGLILIADSLAQIQPYLAEEIADDMLALLAASTETPVTWLVPFKQDSIPAWITGEHSRLAVRISYHPLVKQLCHRVGMPIVSTSANPPRCKPAMTASQVQTYFDNDVLICEGEIGQSTQPSMIKDLLTGAVIRD